MEVKVQESLSKIDAYSQHSNAKKTELEAAISIQMENARSEKQSRENQNAIQFEVSQAEQDLRRLTSKVLFFFITYKNIYVLHY